MNADGFTFFMRWWSEQLVRALLWGVWRFVLDRDGEAQDRAFRRFTALVHAAPLWPCFVEYTHPRDMMARVMKSQCLVILSDDADVQDHLEWDLWE